MRKATLFAVVTLLLGVAGCGGTSTSSNAPPPSTATPPADCLTVPAVMIQAIRDALDPGIHAQGFRATTSTNSGGTVYLVAANLSGNGIDEVATWATPDMADPARIYSADQIASTYSAWGLTPGGGLYGEQGFDEAGACARAAKVG